MIKHESKGTDLSISFDGTLGKEPWRLTQLGHSKEEALGQNRFRGLARVANNLGGVNADTQERKFFVRSQAADYD